MNPGQRVLRSMVSGKRICSLWNFPSTWASYPGHLVLCHWLPNMSTQVAMVSQGHGGLPKSSLIPDLPFMFDISANGTPTPQGAQTPILGDRALSLFSSPITNPSAKLVESSFKICPWLLLLSTSLATTLVQGSTTSPWSLLPLFLSQNLSSALQGCL